MTEHRREYMKRWRAANVEKRRASRNAWAKNNPEKLNGQRRRLRAKYRPKIQAYMKAYAEKNAERLKLNRRKYYMEHRAERIAYSIKYRKEHRVVRPKKPALTPVQLAARSREWRRNNPDKCAKVRHNRRQAMREEKQADPDKFREKIRLQRAKQRPQINRHFHERYHNDKEFRERLLTFGRKRTKAQRFIRGEMPVVLMKWFDIEGICYICGEQVRYAKITVDHVWPVVKGGEDHVGNLMPVHGRCNSIKGKRTQFSIARPDLLALCCGQEKVA